MLMAATDELENGYLAVLQGIEDTSRALRQIRRSLVLRVSDRKLDDCLERLESYAENLHGLDQRLGRMIDSGEDALQRSRHLPRYAALLQLGSSGYDRLYRDYSTLRKLRDRRFFLLFSMVGSAVGLICGVMLALL